jgi:hypothetical protein
MARLALIAIAVMGFLHSGFSQTATTTTTAIPAATSMETQTASPTLPKFEIDVVFPLPNVTYNFTDYIPLVFAFQNLSAAATLGPFRLLWGIMPYNTLEDPIPGGVFEDEWSIKLSAENVSMFENQDGSPYILVNSTNTTNTLYPEKWAHRPHYGEISVYALKWYVKWDVLNNRDAYSCPGANLDRTVFFHVQPEFDTYIGPNPGDLGNMTDTCAQFGILTEINKEEEDKCNAPRELPSANANSCAVKVDDEMVNSISSQAAALAKPTETRSSTTTTSLSTNAAAVPTVQVLVQPIVAALGLLAVL